MKLPAFLAKLTPWHWAVYGLALVVAVAILFGSMLIVGAATIAIGIVMALFFTIGKPKREQALYYWWSAAALVILGAAALVR